VDETQVAEQQAAAPWGSRIRVVAAVLVHRLPFTTSVLLVMLALGSATGTLWNALMERDWFRSVAYGLPSLAEGRWWTPVTGSFFALSPAFYVPVLISFTLFVGFAEWRMGTRRAALTSVLGQFVGVLGAALTLFVFQDSGWPWAAELAPSLDAGFSAGALACAAAATATMRPPWRLRVQAGLCVYVLVSFLFMGSLADLEHLWAVAFALPLGTRLAGPRAIRRTRSLAAAGRREWRLLAAIGLTLIATAELVLLLFPADGPLGSTRGAEGSAWGVALDLVVVGLIVNGLRKGRRWAWWFAVALALLNIVAGVVVGSSVLVDDVLGVPEGIALSVAASVLWAAELAVLVLARRAFRAPSRRKLRRRGTPEATGADTARELLTRHGGSTLSWMTTWPNNSYFLAPDGHSFVAYQRHAGVAVALGDPVGPPSSRADTVRQFAAMCERAGMVPCLFSITTPAASAAKKLGWQHVQVAEDTLVDLEGLEFKGKKWQDIRSALNRGAKEGISYRQVVLAEQPWAVRTQVRAISDEWVGDKGLPEMGFTLGGVDEALDPNVRVGLAVDGDGSVHGVTSWLPVHGPGGVVHGWTLDVMRRRQDAFKPVVEFLIASSCLEFQAQGAQFVSLSGAPLARSESDAKPPAVERLLDALGAAMEPLYGFRSLHAFKTKFSPRYEPMHLAYRDEGDLPRIGIALTRAYLPDAKTRELVKLATSRGH